MTPLERSICVGGILGIIAFLGYQERKDLWIVFWVTVSSSIFLTVLIQIFKTKP